MSLILVVDKAGNPKNWVDEETAVCYYAREKVLWETGSPIKIYRGGFNDSGEQSSITISSIVGVTGPTLSDEFFRATVHTDRDILYARDKYLCAYCGQQFTHRDLTIDHVHPRSRGGKHIWTNTVASCKSCNHRKGDKTPEEAKMHLLYVPYAPNAFERLYLQNRRIIACQMEFLLNRIPKTSRVWN